MAKGRKNESPTLERAFGQVLSSWRERKGMSQMDLAVASGYSLRYIGDLERGTKSATMRTMRDLATLLNVRLGSLVTESENLLEKEIGKQRRLSKTE